ncbi:hypothetical protein SAMN04488128_1021222 [Chitinophaga eiseniae]|uniref:Uncharacterized protein n=1 Tax=Chitinophaga eiseniae TaxID=634771 RepID=A0A1T4RK43_9BACT|nr:hypothetical protein [Chitinophaga eiseniae]SKA16146.1 hypothetical protein SAMN04488128_1021222 [Chitinophaga eiseniae]
MRSLIIFLLCLTVQCALAQTRQEAGNAMPRSSGATGKSRGTEGRKSTGTTTGVPPYRTGNTAPAVPDQWAGSWKVDYKPWPHIPAVTMQLQIGLPRQNMLYPALLSLNYGSFHGEYYLLLVRKNEQQLGIGRGKYPVKETPFKLGIWMLYLNGTFNYSRKGNDMPVMDIQRMWIKDFGIFMKGLYDDDEIFVSTKVTLRDMLYRNPIQLKKISHQPWAAPAAQKMVDPDRDSIYLGLYDRIDVYDSTGQLTIVDEDQLDKDTVTLVHNGRTLLRSQEINEQTQSQRIRLDTGMNLLAFFADNYGRLPPNTGDMRVEIDGKKYSFDFSDRSNAYATFLVAQLYRRPVAGKPSPDTVSPAIPPLQPPARDTAALTRTATSRKDQWVTTIKVKQQEITLELWDAQTEDGDSISLRLNEKWIVSGFPVKKQIQELKITLLPGENRLQFMADNLGRIPPNTAALRLLFDKISRRVDLSTDMKRNNMIRIIYEQ